MRIQYHLDAADAEMRIFVEPESSTWTIVGTRMQIEAEGVLPLGVEWSKLVGTQWTAGELRFTLSGGLRKKGASPESWLWRLSCECQCQGFNGPAIKHAKRELDRLIFEDSAAGLVQLRKRCQLAESAAADHAFQGFLGKVIHPRVSRTPVTVSVLANSREVRQ